MWRSAADHDYEAGSVKVSRSDLGAKLFLPPALTGYPVRQSASHPVEHGLVADRRRGSSSGVQKSTVRLTVVVAETAGQSCDIGALGEGCLLQ